MRQDTGYSLLPAYAARATTWQRLMLDDVNEQNRDRIVYQARGLFGVPLLFRADGIIIFDFRQIDEFSGGVIEPFEINDQGNWSDRASKQLDVRNKIRANRYRYMNAFLACYANANRREDLCVPLSPASYIWATEDHGKWTLKDNGAGGLITPLRFLVTIDQQILEESVTTFNSAASHNVEEAITVLDMFYRIAFYNGYHDSETTIVLCWAVTERCLSLLWNDFVKRWL